LVRLTGAARATAVIGIACGVRADHGIIAVVSRAVRNSFDTGAQLLFGTAQ
jgi:hypothetical protein